jgi:hypothetical protein
MTLSIKTLSLNYDTSIMPLSKMISSITTFNIKDTQHNGINTVLNTIGLKMTLSTTPLSSMSLTVKLSITSISITTLGKMCRMFVLWITYAECCYTECRYADFRYAKCRDTELCHTIFVTLSY